MGFWRVRPVGIEGWHYFFFTATSLPFGCEQSSSSGTHQIKKDHP